MKNALLLFAISTATLHGQAITAAANRTSFSLALRGTGLNFAIPIAPPATASPAVTVTATPGSATFTYQIGAALPSPVTISVRTNTGTPTFTAVVAPPPPGETSLWLTVSPSSGKLPGSLSLRANPTSLGVGTYNGSITVTVAGVATPLSIPVTLVVNAAPSALALSSTALNFVVPIVPPATNGQTVLLSTTSAPISFTATAGTTSWLQVSPGVGMVLPGYVVPLGIVVNPSGLNPQAAPYVGKITVGAGAGTATRSQTITVNLTVNSSPPTITNIWPSTLPMNAGAQTVTIYGTNIYKATVAKVQGVAAPLTTTQLNDTAVLAIIPANLLTTATTLNVLLSNPAPGGDSATSPLIVANAPTIAAIANAASYDTTAISPGELVSIFGANIGPSAQGSMNITGGFVDKTLGGVSVKVDGQDAPILFVSQNQVNIQIPYEVTVGAAKTVVLTNGANPPVNSTVTIAAADPGIFTSDPTRPGAGQAAVLNYDATTLQYTLNTAANPAKLGDTILLYLTGEGDYPPGSFAVPSHTGYTVPATLNPLPQLNPLPTVMIGGAAATVSYAGPILNSIVGVLQINAVVPAASTTGTGVPVVVSVGANNSQANVTIAVHP